MPIDLTEYKEVIDGALANGTPCVVATASARGEPNISLRGSTMVFDAQHLAYWDRAHGRQQEHVGENPHVVVFYRDPPRRISWRLYGQATVHAGGPIREQVMARAVAPELNRDPERKGVAVVIRVDLVMTLGGQVLQRREQQPETPERTFNIFEAVYTARSIRRFRPDAVPDEMVHRILEAAIQAPNGTNAQSWRFVVVRDPALRRELGALYRQGFREVYPADRLANESDPNRRRVMRSAYHLAEHMGSEPPVLVLACIERGPNTAATRGAGASIYPAVQNLLLAARALGLGACLTTLHLRREAQVKALLGIPEHVDTYALIPLGYPASPHGPLRRRPVAEVTYRDRWASASLQKQ
ncbi:MAG: nitroreductase family protein [Chloroflexi bacterium]|nr:nitroreductase family protein [Chloroflexota bacterium]